VCNEEEERDELLQWNVANFTSTDHQACFYVLSPGVSRYESLLFNTYYCFRVVCVHVLPCTSLVVLNSALLGAIRAAQRRRHRLLRRQPNPDGSARLLAVSQRQRPSPDGSARLLRPDNDQAPAATSTEDVRRGHGQGRTGSERRRSAVEKYQNPEFEVRFQSEVPSF